MGKHSQYQQWTRAWIRDNNNTTIMMTITRMTAANILYKLKIRCHLLSVLSLWAETFFSKPYLISYSCVALLLLTVAIIIVPHRYAIQSSTYVLSAVCVVSYNKLRHRANATKLGSNLTTISKKVPGVNACSF
jgi:CBS domain containing-hemolysin-like protein